MRRCPVLVLLLLLGSSVPAVPSAQCVETEVVSIPAPGLPAGSQFGVSVALSGDVLLVGAPLVPHEQMTLVGAVFVYRYDGVSWNPEQTLTPSVPEPGLRFGFSVTVDGDVAAVGAPFDSTGGSQAGLVTVFRHDGATWLEEQKLLPGEINAQDRWGTSVALSGDRLIGGAPYEDCGSTGDVCGAAYVYRYDGALWHEEAEFTTFLTDQEFGQSVDIDGAYAVVGGPHTGSLFISSAGYAGTFHHDGAFWGAEPGLYPSDIESEDWYGYSVALDGADVLVGRPRDDAGGTDDGSAHFFENSLGGWEESANPGGTSPGSTDWFGFAVGLDDGVAVAGAPFSDGASVDLGHADLYRDAGGTWVSVVRLEASDAAQSDRLGTAVAIDGTTVAVGAPFRNVGAMADVGAVYLYTVPPLALEASPIAASALQPVSFHTCGGLPGGLQAVILTELAGVPQLLPLSFDVFDAEGKATFTAPVPPGLAGLTADFVSYGHYLPGVPGPSAPVTITFL